MAIIEEVFEHRRWDWITGESDPGELKADSSPSEREPVDQSKDSEGQGS